MAIKDMRKGWRFILKNMERQTRWSKAERKIPITQSVWFTSLILHILDYRVMTDKQDKINHAFVVFGHLSHYLLRNYSIVPAADILVGMERNEKRVFDVPERGKPYVDPETGVNQVTGFYRQNPHNALDLIANIVATGYERCGSQTVYPFAYWLSSAGVDLSKIRELLVRDIEDMQDHEAEEQQKRIESGEEKAPVIGEISPNSAMSSRFKDGLNEPEEDDGKA